MKISGTVAEMTDLGILSTTSVIANQKDAIVEIIASVEQLTEFVDGFNSKNKETQYNALLAIESLINSEKSKETTRECLEDSLRNIGYALDIGKLICDGGFVYAPVNLIPEQCMIPRESMEEILDFILSGNKGFDANVQKELDSLDTSEDLKIYLVARR